MNKKVKFSECVQYMIKGPFGSDMKKSLYVPKGEDTYKVYIQGNAIQKDETLGDYYVSSEYFHQKLERFEVHPGDYIITCDGTLGKFIKLSDATERGVISSSLLLLKLDEDVIYDKYFEILWEHSMLSYLASQARNACLVHLPSAKAIGDVEIDLPSMEDQKRLADTAFKVLNIIESRNVELAKLDDLIKARFVEMFEQGNYDEVEFESVVEFLRNGANIKQTKGASGIPITRIETLSNDVFNIDRLGYADVFELGKYESYKLQNGDILISHINSVAYLGRAVQYRGQLGDEPIIHGMNLLCARIKDNFNPTYIEFFFKTPKAKDYISTITKKAVNQASITTSDLKKMLVPAPPIEAQNEFNDFVKQVDKSKAAAQAALDETQLLFDSLMQKYFG